jgi:DnaA N-terminal domain
LAGVKPAASVYAEMVRQELQAAVQVCPRLRPLLPDHVLANPASATPADAARIAAAAPSLLPEPERNNGLSMQWGWARHGIRAVAMLAIALEDPKVRNPCSYFGWMATRSPDGAPDLRLNLARILREKGVIPPLEDAPAPKAEPPGEVLAPPSPALTEDAAEPLPLMFAPGVEDPRWQAIDVELRRLIREGAYGSWFGRIGFHGLTDGVLNLSTPNSTSADRIKRDYIPAILMAAETAGVFVDRVLMTVRKR